MTAGRVLKCTRCHADVTVHELPVCFLDSARYVCGWCLDDRLPGLLEQPVEERRYDPDLAALPGGY
jgi:hypothetical protein